MMIMPRLPLQIALEAMANEYAAPALIGSARCGWESGSGPPKPSAAAIAKARQARDAVTALLKDPNAKP